MNRRNFIRNSMYGALLTSVRAASIGVPANFLISGVAHAAVGDAKFTILSQSQQGESHGCNGPGAYGNGAAALVEHPLSADLGTATIGSVDGVDYSALDLESSAEIRLGTETVKASRPWQSVPQGFLDNLSCIWHRTSANAHPEFPSVRRLKGALRDDVNPSREEELASAIALENAAALGTALNTPLLLDDGGFSKGNPLAVYKPTELKGLFATGSSGSGLDPALFSEVYKQTIDKVYRDVKQSGTAKQRAYLDNHALTRLQARDLGENLGDALNQISGNGFVNQLRAAAAFIRLRVSPVVVVEHDFGGDNHSDAQLEAEATETLDSLDALVQYWQFIQDEGIQDVVNFATLDTFGRTPLRNEEGGRDHYGDMTLGLIHGRDIKPGMIGGLTTNNKDLPVAMGINSSDGSTLNADIDPEATLSAYGKTIMKAAGIADDRLDLRVPTGKVITALFDS